MRNRVANVKILFDFCPHFARKSGGAEKPLDIGGKLYRLKSG